MPAETTQQFFGAGIAVEVGQIHRELKKLWQDSDQTATRASRLNLVIYSAAEHSLRANTVWVEKIALQHALRAILIAAKPNRPENRVRAWINAHCQLSKSGAKQRCSEQIAFQLEGASSDFKLIPNIVFSHLDSDLPLYLWWQGDFPPSPDKQLMAWVDRLIFDSGAWTKPAEQFAVLRQICAVNHRLETSLGDLSWTRLTTLRFALAQLFDPPAARPALDEISSVEITHSAECRLAALFLAAWLASQLDWKPVWIPGGRLEFWRTNSTVALKLIEQPASEAAHISQVTLRSGGGAEFTVARPPGSDFLNTSVKLAPGERPQSQVLPAGSHDLADLVSEELTHSGNHQTYLKVLETLGTMVSR